MGLNPSHPYKDNMVINDNRSPTLETSSRLIIAKLSILYFHFRVVTYVLAYVHIQLLHWLTLDTVICIKKLEIFNDEDEFAFYQVSPIFAHLPSRSSEPRITWKPEHN